MERTHDFVVHPMMVYPIARASLERILVCIVCFRDRRASTAYACDYNQTRYPPQPTPKNRSHLTPSRPSSGRSTRLLGTKICCPCNP